MAALTQKLMRLISMVCISLLACCAARDNLTSQVSISQAGLDRVTAALDLRAPPIPDIGSRPQSAGGFVVTMVPPKFFPSSSDKTTNSADPGAWKPTEADVIELERHIVLPRFANRLDAYARWYEGVTQSGKRLIHGTFNDSSSFSSDPPGIHIELEVPIFVYTTLLGHRCDVIYVMYDPETKTADIGKC
jgi:hypothetical protein